MRQAVHAGIDGDFGIVLSRDMRERHFMSRVCGGNQGAHGRGVQARHVLAVGGPVLENDLDIVRALGAAGSNEGGRFGGCRESRNGKAVFGPMAMGNGRQGAGRPQVSDRGRCRALAFAPCGRNLMPIAEHVELRRDAKTQRVAACAAPAMRVRVDEARQQGAARTVDGRDSLRRAQVIADRRDHSVADQDVGGRDDALAVEHARIVHEEALAGGRDPCRRVAAGRVKRDDQGRDGRQQARHARAIVARVSEYRFHANLPEV